MEVNRMTDLTISKPNTNEEQIMKDIIKYKGGNLPAKIEDVINVFEFTDFKAKAWKILADKMSKLEEQTDLYQSALRSGQQWGIASLYAQKRIGEITRDSDIEYETCDSTVARKKRSKSGMKERTYTEAEQIAKNPEILEDVIDTAKERNEIPTKTAVLGRIKAENRKSINEKATKKSNNKIANEKTSAVKDYYDGIKGFTAVIKSAIISAEHGDFSAEGNNFLVKKNNVIRKLLKELEDLI